MTDGRDEDLYADRGFRPGPPPELREPPPRRSRALGVFVATFALAAFAGVVWYAYDQGLQRGTEATAPLIKADPRPTKVRPEQPGGLQVPNQDKLVYEAMRPGETEAPKVERLLPPPEKPVEPPAPPPPPPPVPVVTHEAPPPPAPSSATAAVPAAEPAAPSASPSTAQAATPETRASDSEIPPARIVTPPPAPAIPKPAESAPTPAKSSEPTPLSPRPVATVPPPPPPTPVPVKPMISATAKIDTSSAAKASPPAPGNFRIQLGALREEASAEAEWSRLQKRYSGELGGLGHRIQRVDLGGGKGVFFRIQSSGVSEASAEAICAGLKGKGQPCIVVRP